MLIGACDPMLCPVPVPQDLNLGWQGMHATVVLRMHGFVHYADQC